MTTSSTTYSGLVCTTDEPHILFPILTHVWQPWLQPPYFDQAMELLPADRLRRDAQVRVVFELVCYPNYLHPLLDQAWQQEQGISMCAEIIHMPGVINSPPPMYLNRKYLSPAHRNVLITRPPPVCSPSNILPDLICLRPRSKRYDMSSARRCAMNPRTLDVRERQHGWYNLYAIWRLEAKSCGGK